MRNRLKNNRMLKLEGISGTIVLLGGLESRLEIVKKGWQTVESIQ